MKKVLLSLLVVMALFGCAKKEPKIEVKNQTITTTVGATKASFKDQLCDSIAVYNAAGEEVGCQVIFYPKPVSTAKEGEFDMVIAYKDGENLAQATLKLVVTKAAE